MKLKVTRAQLRGSMLMPECNRAKISKHEFGPDDERCFCLGMKPDPATCRWLDRYFGDVCRHPTGEPAGPWFFEPTCKPCRSCGYQPITPKTPAWDDPGEEEKKGTK